MKRSLWFLLALGASLALASCDEGGGSPPVDEESPEIVELDLRGFTDDAGHLTTLEDPFSPEETAAIAETFDWADTEAVAELDDQGRPALYYGLIYVSDRDHEAILDMVGIYYDPLPIFEEERERWAGQAGEFGLSGDGTGVFVHAILGGEMYNALRDAALGGEAVFDVVGLREAPPSIERTGVGSLSYESLMEAGFTYGLDAPDPIDMASATLTQKRRRRLLRRLVSIGERLVNGARMVIGEANRFFNGSRAFTFRLFVHNTDPAFGGAAQMMRRSWGPDIGEPVWLENVEVRVRQGAGLKTGNTDELGMLGMAISRNRAAHVCIVTKNHAAEVGNAWLAGRVCSFQDGAGTGGTLTSTRNWVHANFRVSSGRVNALAQVSEGYAYAQEVLDFTPHRARVLVGFWSDTLSMDDRPFALCGSFDPRGDGATSAVGSLSRSVFDLGSFLYLYSDIIAPEASLESRGTMSHEYGHFLMCSMLVRSSKISFTDAWSQVVGYSVISLGSPDADDETLYMIEGFADFIAGQLVGGVDYFRFAVGAGTSAGGTFYCDPNATPTTPCLEDNIGGPTPVTPAMRIGNAYKQRLAFVATLLHDAFDGHATIDGNPGEGAAFAPNSTGGGIDPEPLRPPTLAPRDEAVALTGDAIFDFFENWADLSPNIHEQPMLNGLAQTMLDHGHSANEVCDLFALHSPTGDCTDVLSDAGLSSGDVAPSTPLALACVVSVVGPVGPPLALCSWSDISTFGTSFDALGMGEAGYRETATRPYARTQSHRFTGLDYDDRVTVTVATVNGEQTSAPATVVVNTPPEPADLPTGLPLRGGAAVSWAAARASEYVVRMRDPRGVVTEVVRTTDTSVDILGLEGGARYEFEIISVGRTGQRARASALVVVIPSAPSVVHVSDRLGDDGAAGVGAATAPFRTLGAAVADALATDAQVVRVESGTYLETAAIRVAGAALLIEGGYDYDGAAGWSPGVGITEVTLTTAMASGTCVAGGFDGVGGRDTVAGILVDSTATLALRTLALDVGLAASGTACTSVVRSDGGDITLENVDLTVAGAAIGGVCSAPLQVLGDGSTSVTLRSSRLASEVSGTPTGGQLAGACLQGAPSVMVADSELLAVRAMGASNVAISSAYGLVGSDIGSVRVTRSTLSAMVGDESRVVTGGDVAGLWLRASGSVLLDNTVVRSPTGGDTNRALDIGAGSTGSLGGLALFFVTATAGADWYLERALPPGAEAATLGIVGVVDEVRIVNSLLLFAAGASVERGLATVIDPSRLDGEPATQDLRSSAYSFPWFREPWGSFQDCRIGEFFVLREEATLNDPRLRRCDVSATSSDEASGNTGFWNPPGASDMTPFMRDGMVVFVASTPRASRSAVLTADGHPLSVDGSGAPLGAESASVARLRTGGVVLRMDDPVAEVSRDRGGAERSTAASSGVGAWTY